MIAESFLPQTNGVVHTVLRVLEHAERRGVQALVIAPGDPAGVPAQVNGAPVVTVPSWPLPQYRDVRVAACRTSTVAKIIEDFGADMVHVASPFVLGWKGVKAAERVGVPSVAIFQTDMPGFARRYSAGSAERIVWRRVADIHERATLNLVPSQDSMSQLSAHGVPRLRMWRRGVDSERFHPGHRDDKMHRTFARGDRKVIGFVGRLAPEKQVEAMAMLHGDPRFSLVIIGDGPERERLQTLLPEAHFTGMLHGAELAQAMASIDILLHPGEAETFCQVIQEGMASSVPVIAPAIGGPRDLVDHGRSGWLYPPGDWTTMRMRVLDLAGDDMKRRVMGATGRSIVVSRSWETLCAELFGYYEEARQLHRHSLLARR